MNIKRSDEFELALKLHGQPSDAQRSEPLHRILLPADWHDSTVHDEEVMPAPLYVCHS